MRKGAILLKLIDFKDFQKGDIAFRPDTVECIRWQGDESRLEYIKKEPYVECLLMDEKTEELFPFNSIDQCLYIYRYCFENPDKYKRFPFVFFTIDDNVRGLVKGVVMCKDSTMMSKIGQIAPLANAYGQYVAQQKAAGEGAKEFTDWYFEISV